MLDQTASSLDATHPLDPPTFEEVEAGGRLAKAKLGERAAFCSVRLNEPNKEALRKYERGKSIDRVLRFDGFDHPAQGEPRWRLPKQM